MTDRDNNREAGIDPRLADLKFLRKGAGASRGRIQQRSGLLLLTDAASADQALERISAGVHFLAEGSPKSLALRVALGLDSSSHGGDVSDRRKKHAGQLGVSSATLRRWEDEALLDLLALLRSWHHPLPEVPSPPFLLTLVASVYRYHGRHWVATRHIREVVSLVPAAPWFRWGTSEPVAVSGLKGASYQLDSRGPNGDVHRLNFPKVLSVGERHRFEFVETRPAGTALQSYEELSDSASQSFEMPTSKAIIEVRFDGEIPPTIWAYDQLHRFERPGTPQKGRLLSPNDQRRVRAEFHGLYGGFLSGIAWQWPKGSGRRRPGEG